MFTTYASSTSASSFLVISNLITNLKITNITIPEVIQKGNTTAVTLDCDYSAIDGDFTLRWYFEDDLIYEWTPSKEPAVSGVLKGRLDLSYVFRDPLKEHRGLRILAPDESLSGKYTCAVNNSVSEDKRSGNMLVFSPQSELLLDWYSVWNSDVQRHMIQVVCTARGLYPLPELVLERKGMPVDKQHQRVWPNGDGELYDAETLAEYEAGGLQDIERFTCRLAIPAAGYSAMFDKPLVFRNGTTPSNKSNICFVPKIMFLVLISCLINYIII